MDEHISIFVHLTIKYSPLTLHHIEKQYEIIHEWADEEVKEDIADYYDDDVSEKVIVSLKRDNDIFDLCEFALDQVYVGKYHIPTNRNDIDLNQGYNENKHDKNTNEDKNKRDVFENNNNKYQENILLHPLRNIFYDYQDVP